MAAGAQVVAALRPLLLDQCPLSQRMLASLARRARSTIARRHRSSMSDRSSSDVEGGPPWSESTFDLIDRAIAEATTRPPPTHIPIASPVASTSAVTLEESASSLYDRFRDGRPLSVSDLVGPGALAPPLSCNAADLRVQTGARSNTPTASSTSEIDHRQNECQNLQRTRETSSRSIKTRSNRGQQSWRAVTPFIPHSKRRSCRRRSPSKRRREKIDRVYRALTSSSLWTS